MRIAFASSHPYLPELAGGLQSNTHELACELAALGHQPIVFAGLIGSGIFGLRKRAELKLRRTGITQDRSLGYPVLRTWKVWEQADALIEAARPDALIVQSGDLVRVAAAFRGRCGNILLYLHNIEFDTHGGDAGTVSDLRAISNSDFTATRYRREYGIRSEVINPVFRAERYKTPGSGTRVLFVNPHPLKGLDVALSVAGLCPGIPFDFVESWTLSPEDRNELHRRAAALANVRLHPPTPDIRKHYRNARIVLVPSRWEETWGRVASEAHFSGIPVIGSRVGGLTEAIGPGGITLAPDAPAREWADALARLWADDAAYRQLSRAALAYSERATIDAAVQARRLLALVAQSVPEAANRAFASMSHDPAGMREAGGRGP